MLFSLKNMIILIFIQLTTMFIVYSKVIYNTLNNYLLNKELLKCK